MAPPTRAPPAQRRHDGLEAALRLVLRAKELPDVGGTVATVLLTATVDQWDSDTGLVTTGHGALISVAQAKRIAGGDPTHRPRRHRQGGRDHRLRHRRTACSTATQRCAIYARDKGCTWPGCDAPAALVRNQPRQTLDPRRPNLRRQRRPTLRPTPPKPRLQRLDRRS